MTTFDHTRKQGDTADPLEITLTDAGGDYAVPGGASVLLFIRKVRAATNILAAGVMTPDPDQEANPGKCTYQWQAGDVSTPGSFNFEVKVVLPDETEIRFPRDGAAPYGTMLVLRNLEPAV